jgi:hypothetical protein
MANKPNDADPNLLSRILFSDESLFCRQVFSMQVFRQFVGWAIV